MEKELIRACRSHNYKSAIEYMMKYYNGAYNAWCGTCDNQVDFNADAIDDENLTVRTDVFLATMCEFDDMTVKINNLLHRYDEDIDTVVKKLKAQDYDIELEDGQYTYNWDNDLTHDIAYTRMDIGHDCYAFIRVHCFGDARGGFSPLVCFKLTDVDYFYFTNVEGWCREKDDTSFESSYDIERNCTYDNEKKQWYYEGMEVSLYSPANGF